MNPKAKFLNRHDAKKRQGYQGSEEHDTHERHRSRRCLCGFRPEITLCRPWRPRWRLGGGTVFRIRMNSCSDSSRQNRKGRKDKQGTDLPRVKPRREYSHPAFGCPLDKAPTFLASFACLPRELQRFGQSKNSVWCPRKSGGGVVSSGWSGGAGRADRLPTLRSLFTDSHPEGPRRQLHPPSSSALFHRLIPGAPSARIAASTGPGSRRIAQPVRG
jgi:hypothetical protein